MGERWGGKGEVEETGSHSDEGQGVTLRFPVRDTNKSSGK